MTQAILYGSHPEVELIYQMDVYIAYLGLRYTESSPLQFPAGCG